MDTQTIPMGQFVYDWYDFVLVAQDYADERVVNWFLMSSHWPSLAATVLYVASVFWLGPRVMTGRKPFQLNTPMMLYNLFQVAFNSYLVHQFVKGGWFNGYDWHCQPVEKAPSPRGLIMASAMYWYFISKFVDFIDTGFFVLRKKYNQITFLHVGHHATLPFFCWYYVRFVPGGQIAFFAFLNSAVHVIMYSYYFLAGLGPHVQKYLWWKKYLTAIQMVQFIIIVVHLGQLLFCDCDFPKFPMYLGLIFGPWIFVLFLGFYMDSYLQSKSNRQKLPSLQTVKNGL